MRKGVTIIELMVAMIIFALIITALWRVYSASQRNALEILTNHEINDEIDRTLLKITDDLRESNYIFENCPAPVFLAQVDGLKTSDTQNQLMFTKILYDFTVDPISLPDDEVNYTQNRIRYFVEKEDESNPDSLWVLNREMLPFDKKRQAVDSQMTVFPILSGIKECIFYKLKDPDASRSGNIYIKLKLARNETGPNSGKYTNEITVSVKERGASPE
ncbi:MAG: prepilin-type N-terminal cleavage/methylation domain-containing protein [Erysipelotrichia bacterium]|nr:prepilin-type N-terminal cleavage/methylation domain-containing protein [Erysipelotrichia bacterium]